MEENSAEEFAELFEESFGQKEKIARALELLRAVVKSRGQYADAYIRHNIGVATTVLRLGFDRNAVLAGLLHNAPRMGLGSEEIAREFGKAVLEIIEQQERFEKALVFRGGDMESARKKLLIVLSTNPQAVILQLCEMLDKIRNLGDVPEEEQKGFISEVKELYAPLAHKLGIYTISSEMNELAFRFEQPETYAKTQTMITEIVSRSTSGLQETRDALEASLKNAGIEAKTFGRVKTVYSTHQKMKGKGVGIGRIYDLMAIRIVTGSEKECYEALGIVHSLWKPIPEEFDDYIAKPKENGYKSLHTSVFTKDMTPIEIQIRTKEMQDFAEFGIASHWAYKGEKTDSRYDKKIDWIKQLIDWEKTTGWKTEIDLFGKEVFAMTPKGEIIELPYGATVLDFAYAVHSDLGDRSQGARVNAVMAGLNTQIRNGDVVEIATSSKQTPKMGWLGFVKTQKAKHKIRARLKMGIPQEPPKKKKLRASLGMATSDHRVRLAKCCLPLPGDGVVGFRTTKRKIAVHRSDCPQAIRMKGKMDVYWGSGTGNYDAEIIVQASDRVGMLKDLLEIFSRSHLQVKATNARSGAMNNIICRFSVAVKNLAQVEDITGKISALKGVTRVYRE